MASFLGGSQAGVIHWGAVELHLSVGVWDAEKKRTPAIFGGILGDACFEKHGMGKSRWSAALFEVSLLMQNVSSGLKSIH